MLGIVQPCVHAMICLTLPRLVMAHTADGRYDPVASSADADADADGSRPPLSWAPSSAVVEALKRLVSTSACASLNPINSRAMLPVLYLTIGLLSDRLGLLPLPNTTTGAATAAPTGAHVTIVPVSLPAGAGIGSSASLCVATGEACGL